MSVYGFSSLNQDRIFQISNKLAGIQTGIDSDRGTKLDQLERKCQALEEHLWESQEQINKKFSQHKSQLDMLNENLNTLKESREFYFDSKFKELSDLESALNGLISKSDQDKTDSDSKYQKLFDDRLNMLKLDLARESQARGEAKSMIKAYFDEKIKGFESILSSERIEIEKSAEIIEVKLTENVSKTQDLIEIERKAREETEEAMLVMLQDLIARIKSEIEQERAERETSEETLLGLLEETCAKLNSLTNL